MWVFVCATTKWHLITHNAILYILFCTINETVFDVHLDVILYFAILYRQRQPVILCHCHCLVFPILSVFASIGNGHVHLSKLKDSFFVFLLIFTCIKYIIILPHHVGNGFVAAAINDNSLRGNRLFRIVKVINCRCNHH